MEQANHLKKNRHDFILVVIGRILVALLTLISIRAVTTYLNPAQFGELSILISLQTFFALIFINPVGQFINLKTHKWWDDRQIVGYLKLFQHYFLLIAVVGFITAFIVGEELSEFGLYYGIVISLMIWTASWNGILVYLLNMLGFRLASIVMALISSLVALGASIYLVAHQPSATAWLLGQAVGMFFGALISIIYLQKKQGISDTKRINQPSLNKAALWNYCVPLSIATAFMWCQLSGYRFVVEHHWGLVALGIMSIGLQIPSQIGVLVESLVMQFLYPYFYSHINQDMTKHGLDEAMSDLVNVVIPIYILICGGIMLGGPYLVKLIVGANFQVTSNLLAIGAFIELFRMSANLLGNAAHAKQKTSLLTMPYFVGAATIFILLIVASVFEVSIDDAAFSLVIGGILMCSYMAAKIFCSIRIHFSKGKYIALLFLLASMTVGSFFLPEIDGIIPNLLALCIAGVFIFIMLVIFLRRSIALKRILSVPLKVG